MQNVPDFNNTDFKTLFDQIIEDLKSHPKIVGISLHGSLACGEQDGFSDVDLDILICRNWNDLENTLERIYSEVCSLSEHHNFR